MYVLFFSYLYFVITDGTNVVRAEMQLSVLLVTDAMLFNSVTLRLDDMDQESFLSHPQYNYFVDGLAAIIPCPKENVFVFNIQVLKYFSVSILVLV